MRLKKSKTAASIMSIKQAKNICNRRFRLRVRFSVVALNFYLSRMKRGNKDDVILFYLGLQVLYMKDGFSWLGKRAWTS